MSTAMDTLQLIETQARELPHVVVQPHPSADRVAMRNVGWVQHFGLVADEAEARRLLKIRAGSFSAHTYSYGSQAHVQLGADLILWLYLFDDQIGEAPDGAEPDELRRRFVSYRDTVLQLRVPSKATPFHHALLDLVERAMSLGASEDWVLRFGHSLFSYFEGCLGEVPLREKPGGPDLDEYRAVRTLSVGAMPVFDLIELAEGSSLSAVEARRPDLCELREIAARLCAWVNDIHSYPKEAAAGDPLNLVHVLIKTYECNVAEALSIAVEVFSTELQLLEEGMAKLFVEAPPSTRLYLQKLLHWVHGNTCWTWECGRYHH